jgi:hypothetical protein
MNQEPWPELDPLELLELGDPEVENLLLLAARERRMDPSDYLAILVECDRRGNKPLWKTGAPRVE